MGIENQGTVRPISSDRFRFQNWTREDNVEIPTVNAVRGQEIMQAMILSQYDTSPLLQAYIMAYVSEMDILFEQIEAVYLGRHIMGATGAQLDVIGHIVGAPRAKGLLLPHVWFGFDGDPLSDQMADEATPGDGGQFISEDQTQYTQVPMNDGQYRRLLLAKASMNNRRDNSHDNIIRAAIILMGRCPERLHLIVNSDRNMTLNISRDDTTDVDQGLLAYLAQWCVPMGTIFDVTRTV